MKILLVEDDAAQARRIRYSVQPEHTLDVATTIEQAEDAFQLAQYELFIIDLQLPDGNGIDFCQYLRKNKSSAAVLILTGAGSLQDKVRSFTSGADDFLTKPFHAEELTLRLRALGRRSQTPYTDDTISVNELKLSANTRTVHRGNKKIFLRPKEFDILQFLMKHSGRVVTRSSLLNYFWTDDQETYSNVVDAHIKNIREAIDKPFSTHTIKTVHGLGYKIEK